MRKIGLVTAADEYGGFRGTYVHQLVQTIQAMRSVFFVRLKDRKGTSEFCRVLLLVSESHSAAYIPCTISPASMAFQAWSFWIPTASRAGVLFD